jgi:hypothetical protein
VQCLDFAHVGSEGWLEWRFSEIENYDEMDGMDGMDGMYDNLD